MAPNKSNAHEPSETRNEEHLSGSESNEESSNDQDRIRELQDQDALSNQADNEGPNRADQINAAKDSPLILAFLKSQEIQEESEEEEPEPSKDGLPSKDEFFDALKHGRVRVLSEEDHIEIYG